MFSKHRAKKIYDALLNAEALFVIPHQQPDGDALGAATAISGWLSREGKAHTLYCVTDHHKQLAFLPHRDQLTQDTKAWANKSIRKTILVLDSGDLRYAGIDALVTAEEIPPIIINIDHHKSNILFGDLNILDVHASSTCELLYRFFKANDVALNSDIATSLLTGIITDTDNFHNDATTPRAMRIGSELLALGGAMDLIKKHTYQSTPLHALGLWGTIFTRLKKHERFDLVCTYVTQEDLKVHNSDAEVTLGLANFLNSMNEGKVRLVLKEETGGRVKGSLRTTEHNIDVSKIAKALGGGGHQKAAGFHIMGSIDDAFEQVFTVIHNLQMPELLLAV